MVSFCVFNLLIAIEFEHHFILLFGFLLLEIVCSNLLSFFLLIWSFFVLNMFWNSLYFYPLVTVAIISLFIAFFLFTSCYVNKHKFFMLVLLD